MGQHNIIELNGKQYDALTGALLGESKITATPETKAAHLKRQGRAVDGFIRHHEPANNLKPKVIKPTVVPRHEAISKVAAVAAPHPTQSVAKQGGKSMGGITKAKHVAPRPAKTMAAHQPEKPKTLMRHVVKKPEATMKPAIKATAPAEMMARPTSTLAKPLEKKLSVSQVNPVRLGRAQRVPKSHHIRRFSATRKQQQEQQAVQASDVAAVPAAQPARRPEQYAQYAARPAWQGSRPSQAQNVQHTDPHAAQAAVEAPKAGHTDVFEAALAHATSHEQKPIQTRRQTARRKRFVSVLAGLGAFLVIAGFIAYLNKPAIELRVASMRAGFHAQMPGYKPTGYAMVGGVKTSDSKVAMQFRSGESSYQITQEASDWNSSTLLDQAASERGAPTRTIQSKGRTIYIYNDTSATWVNGGVRYEITGSSSMDAGELVSLATSM